MASILYNKTVYKSKIIIPTIAPNSSIVIVKIKSVYGSGKYKYFWVDLPSPTPNSDNVDVVREWSGN